MILQNEKTKPELILKLKEKIHTADAVLVGAGAGLSTSAGFVYSGARFRKYFQDFEEKYGFHDMYSGGFYPYKTPEEQWAFWSRYIYVNRYLNAPKPVYETLLKLIREKDYFVITTNVDHCFQKAGFSKERLFYTQGDYGLWQCSRPCCRKTYDNEIPVRKMMDEQKNMKIPSELIPYCPECGAPMTMNLRSDDTFVEDSGWHEAAKRYHNFLKEHIGQKILFLELGVGYNTPGIIKYPFWEMTAQNPDAVYACLNLSEAVCPQEIEDRSICINDDIGEILDRLCEDPEVKTVKYVVKRIDEDLDFGCEERAEGEPVMAVVTLEDGNGQERKLRYPDQLLWNKKINEGDTVIITEEKELQKWIPGDQKK